MFLNLFLFYQVVRPSGRKSVNKYLYLYLNKQAAMFSNRQQVVVYLLPWIWYIEIFTMLPVAGSSIPLHAIGVNSPSSLCCFCHSTHPTPVPLPFPFPLTSAPFISSPLPSNSTPFCVSPFLPG